MKSPNCIFEVLQQLSTKDNLGFDTFLHWYGPDDLSTYMNLNILIDYSDQIIEYFRNSEKKVDEPKGYIDFAFVFYAQKYIELRSNIKTEVLEKFDDVIQSLNAIYKQFNIGNIFSYLASNFFQLIDCNKHEDLTRHHMLDTIFDIIDKYPSGNVDRIVPNFPRLMHEEPIYILDHYDFFKAVFKAHEELWEDFYNDANLKMLYRKRSETLMETLTELFRSKKDNPKVNKAIHIVMQIGDAATSDNSLGNVMVTDIYLKDLVAFAKNVESSYYSLFCNRRKQLEPACLAYMKEHGMHTSYPIDLTPFHQQICNEAIPFFVRATFITHKKNDLRWLSQAITCFTNDQDDIFSQFGKSNLNTDEVFTRTVIRKIDLLLFVSGKVVRMLIDENTLFQQLMNYIKEILTLEMNPNNDDVIKAEWEHDVGLLEGLLRNYQINQTSQEEPILIYPIVAYCFSFTEKILRLYYMQHNQNAFFKESVLTLSQLLADQSCINNLLSEDLANVLLYLLCEIRESRIGRNWRNRLAHWSSISADNFTKELLEMALYILLSVVNCIAIEVFAGQDVSPEIK